MSADASDAEAVARLRLRHPGAFDELYRLHRDRVWRFVRQLAGRKDWAEESFQETWIAAATHAPSLREDTRLLPWLLTIARNKHRNAVRFRVFDDERKVRAGTEPVGRPPQPDVEADQRQRARQVASAFGQLAEAHREVLLLVIEGLEMEQIAQMLDVRPDAARKRLSRARARLASLDGRVCVRLSTAWKGASVMIDDNEMLASALAELPTPDIDPDLAARVHAIARSAFVAPASEVQAGARLRQALAGAVVPTLIVSAAATRTAETVQVAEQIYDTHETHSRK